MKKRNCTRSGFTLIELLVVIGIIGILGSLILSMLAAAKKRANRAVCLNNMGQIGKALTSVAHDLDGRMPWQLTVPERKFHFGTKYIENSCAIFGIPILKNEIGKEAGILHSPLDTGRRRAFELARKNWGQYDTSRGNLIPLGWITYDLVKGGDFMKPMTILGVTRNLYSRELHKSWWVGSNTKWVLSAERQDPPLPPGMVARMWRIGSGYDGVGPWIKHIQKNSKLFPYGGCQANILLGKFGKKDRLPQVVNGLLEDEGHELKADGSTRKSINNDLGWNGTSVKKHLEAHQVGTHFRALERGLARSAPRRKHIFLKDGTTAPRAAAIVMRQEDPMVREWKYDDFKILGDEEFYTYIASEIELLKNEVPEIYKVAKKHVTTFNCTGIHGVWASICAPGNNWVNISRGAYNRQDKKRNCSSCVPFPADDAAWHTLVLIHEIQHCDWDSCGSEGAAWYAGVHYGKQMKIHPGWVNFVRRGAYSQDEWDYHHSVEYAKNRIPYEDYVKKNGGKFNAGKKGTTK